MMPDKNRIDGWRAIAAYIGRDERTAKRWEKQRGLPVRRIPGAGRANVYLLGDEYEAWLKGVTHGNAEMVPGSVQIEASEAVHVEEPKATTIGEKEDISRVAAEDVARLASQDAGEIAMLATASEADFADVDGVEHLPDAAAMRTFRPREHVSLLVSIAMMAVLLAATTMRFFHLGPFESTMFASERTAGEDPAEVRAQDVSMVRPANPVADRLYLEGVYLLEVRTAASLERARAVFDQAIQEEPNFAPSYGGLAETYLLLREYGTMPEAEAYARGRDAAEHALRLDPNLAEAHAALGFVSFFSQLQAGEAKREFELAARLDANCALAHHWYGSMLTHQGRYPEAIAQLDMAEHIRPNSTAILASKALAMGFAGQRDEAVRLLRAAEESGANSPVLHRNIAILSRIAPEDTRTFLVEMKKFSEMRGDAATAMLLTQAKRSFDREGERAMWSTVLEEERRANPDEGHPTYLMAQAEAALGHDETARVDLRYLAEERSTRLVGMVMEPQFASLRRDIEFGEIAQKMGLSLPEAGKH